MIPKIIHLCWLSGDPFPEDIKQCLNSWKIILPDYEIWLWGKAPANCLGLNIVEHPFDANQTIWTKQAYECKKYAFAADYIRLYALYNYGGIYMDSDVLVFKSFDDLLELPYFIGEDFIHCFEPAIIGAQKGCKWINDVLRRYNGLEFVNKDMTYNITALPLVFHSQLTSLYRFYLTKSIDRFVYDENSVSIFPKEWFNSRNYIKPIKADGAYCSHRFAGSWLKEKRRFNWKRFLPDSVLNMIYFVLYNIVYKNSVSEYQIKFEK